MGRISSDGGIGQSRARSHGRLHTSGGAPLSPNGQWLAYFSPSDQTVQVYNLNGSRNLMMPSQLGEPPV